MLYYNLSLGDERIILERNWEGKGTAKGSEIKNFGKIVE